MKKNNLDLGVKLQFSQLFPCALWANAHASGDTTAPDGWRGIWVRSSEKERTPRKRAERWANSWQLAHACLGLFLFLEGLARLDSRLIEMSANIVQIHIPSCVAGCWWDEGQWLHTKLTLGCGVQHLKWTGGVKGPSDKMHEGVSCDLN